MSGTGPKSGSEGLRLTGQTYYRLDGDLGIDPEEDAVSRYNAKSLTNWPDRVVCNMSTVQTEPR